MSASIIRRIPPGVRFDAKLSSARCTIGELQNLGRFYPSQLVARQGPKMPSGLPTVWLNGSAGIAFLGEPSASSIEFRRRAGAKHLFRTGRIAVSAPKAVCLQRNRGCQTAFRQTKFIEDGNRAFRLGLVEGRSGSSERPDLSLAAQSEQSRPTSIAT